MAYYNKIDYTAPKSVITGGRRYETKEGFLDIFMILASVALGMVLGSSAGGLGLGMSPGWRPTGEPEGLIGSGSKRSRPEWIQSYQVLIQAVAKNAELPRAVAEIKCPESGPRPVAIRETDGIETPSDHRKPAVDSRGPAVSGDKRE